MSVVKRVDSVSDRIPYIILTVRWFDIAANVHASTEDKIHDDVRRTRTCIR
jgi:hypothetical protein